MNQKIVTVSEVDVREKTAANGKPYKSVVLSSTTGDKYFIFANQFDNMGGYQKVSVGDRLQLTLVQRGQYENVTAVTPVLGDDDIPSSNDRKQGVSSSSNDVTMMELAVPSAEFVANLMFELMDKLDLAKDDPLLPVALEAAQRVAVTVYIQRSRS